MATKKNTALPSEVISSFLSFLKESQKEYQDCMAEVYKYDRKPQDYLHDLEFCSDSKERSRIATRIHQDRNNRRVLKDRGQMVEKIAKFYADKQNKAFIDRMKSLLDEQRKAEEFLNSERHYKKRGET